MIRWVIAAALSIAVIYSTVADAAERKPAASYAEAQSAAWKKCQEGTREAWQRYSAEKAAAFDIYAALQKEELIKLRSENKPIYLEWLDASKTGDLAKANELDTVIEIAYYHKAVGAAYGRYKKADKEAFDRYEETARKLFEAYNKADDEAYAAYHAHK